MNRTTIQTISEIVLILLFFTVIYAPPLKCILHPDKKWSNTEKRMLASFPEIPRNLKAISNFFKQFEDYYNDHFGFRDKLIHRYSREMEKRFGLSGVSNVMAGKEGWYFFARDNVLDDFRGISPLTEHQLISWKADLVRKKDWLAKQGIQYLFVLPPSKPTIYPEYLPEAFQNAKGVTHLEQLIDYLDKDPDVDIVNPKPELLKAKTKTRLYYKTDTHWNDYGAFVAYKEIINQISRWFPEDPFKYDFYFHDALKEAPGGDLAKMLDLHKTLKEMIPDLKERHYSAQPMELHLQLKTYRKGREPFMKGCKDARLRALVFRDSMFFAVEPFFSENFNQVIYLWQKYDQKTAARLIEYFHPHIVIDEVGERNCFRDQLD
jgi:alginate O-acetyltransferase complex protein AlgJ